MGKDRIVAVIDVLQIGNCIKYVIHTESDSTPQLVIEQDVKTLVIIHTEVDTALKGQGTGKLLLDKCVADARLGGLKILPKCSYATYQFQKNPDWSDVLVASLNTNK